jgi:Peptidase M61 N-terminal domain
MFTASFTCRQLARKLTPVLTLCCVSYLVTHAAQAQNQLKISYTVQVADIPGQLFHVTTEIRNINQPTLDLSLAVWTPGWYTTENYARNLLRFRVTEGSGAPLRTSLVRKQTWRVETKGIARIKVEFDYLATVLALNQARIAPDYAFFTGTQLFLLPEGHRSSPSTVRFDLPPGWKIITGLDDTADPTVFTAPDYDTLADQPTEMGRFDVTRFMVEGKPHDFVANPGGVFSAENTRTFIGYLTKLAETEARIFNGLPYRRRKRRRAEPWSIKTPLSPSRARERKPGLTKWWPKPLMSFFTFGTENGFVQPRCGPMTTRAKTKPRCFGCPRASRCISPGWLSTAPASPMSRASSTASPRRSQRSKTTKRAATSPHPTLQPRRGSATTPPSPSPSPTTHRAVTSRRSSISRSVTIRAAHRAWTA